MQHEGFEGRRWPIGALAAAAFSALLALEFVGEGRWPTTTEVLLEALELGLLIATTVGVAVLALQLRRQQHDRRELQHSLDAARLEGALWRSRAQGFVHGVAAAIGAEFKRWQLTDAESGVAWFVLKGLSHREIATLRGTSEATVRQQAHAAYEKAGLKGRAAFCAYFLEDLLPSSAEPRAGDAARSPDSQPHETSPAN